MRMRLFPTVEAPSEARHNLDPLAGRLDDGLLTDLRAVVSELVAISVANGASKPIDLSLDFAGDSIEGTVVDDGAGARAIVRASQLRDDSLVLRIVEGLVDEWGATPHETGLWFRLGRPRSSVGHRAV
jgi:anti-sigma regulatory factor (Ser/Thr protein kinase)